MSEKKESLTTERIRKKFKNNFDLCNFSINIARNRILEGLQTNLSETLIAAEERADAAHKEIAVN
jgi:hypothetical protein